MQIRRLFKPLIPRIIAALSISCLVVSAAKAEQHQCLHVFDATAYVGKPDLGRRGIEVVNAFEPDRYWPKGAHNDDLPDPSAAQTWIRRITARQGLLVLDLERWWLRGKDEDVREGMRRYLTVFDWIRAAGYSGPMGYYGVIPTYNRDAAMQDDGSPARAAWRKENDRVLPLAEKVDVLFPSLYTADEDIVSWEKYAIADLYEAKRLARGKPVFPFLWPQYEGPVSGRGLQYMPESEWARELQVVAGNADGLVIWGGIGLPDTGGPPHWDESAPWWQATLAFLAHHELCSGRQ
jgi:Hyaluronidase